MPNEQEKTILTQKIRDPRDEQENPWIDIFEIKVKNTDSSPIIYTNSIITNDNMYKGDEDNSKKPVSTETIQPGAIKSITMYSTEDDSQDAYRPVSTNTIQNNAITTSKIEKGAITTEKISSTYIEPVELTGGENSNDYILKIAYTDKNNNNNSN